MEMNAFGSKAMLLFWSTFAVLAVASVHCVGWQGDCKPYTGSVCLKQLGTRKVYHNTTTATTTKQPPPPLPHHTLTSAPRNPTLTNEEILKKLLEEFHETGMLTTVDGSVDEFCLRPALELMCHFAFPDCVERDSGTMTPLPLCREHCLAVQHLYCYRQWAEIEAKKEKDVVFKTRAHFRLPDCDSLPSLATHGHLCTHSQVHEEPSPADITDHCYTNRGQWYNGTVNVTVSGLACQAWEDNSPQQHERSPLVFPELVGAENYCRNPGSEEERPWCYTTLLETRWEFCDIPPCERDTKNTHTGFQQPSFSLLSVVIITIVCSVGIVVTIFFITLCVVLVRRRKISHPRFKSAEQDDVDEAIAQLPDNAAYHQLRNTCKLNPKLEGYEFPRNDIVFLRDIGQGAFGRVFKAKVPGSSIACGRTIPGETTLIAVKMLKEDASEDLQSDFEREASLMADFDHPNIVKLLGVCAIGKPMCLLFEFMSKGDLNDFLRLCSPDNYNRPVSRSQNLVVDLEDGLRVEVEAEDCEKDTQSQDTECSGMLSTKDQLYISQQISAGMAYLAQKEYVHRDLATRNCLVTNDLIVKISDFGLARSVHSVDYYRGSEQDAIPIRWMPLEAILYNKFSTQSDVWSFGVVLWEIFAFALQPYYGLTHEEVVNYVKSGKVLEQPTKTPYQVYELMKQCWQRRPASRPSFHTLHKALKNIHENYDIERRPLKITDMV